MKIFGLRWWKKFGESKTKLLGIEIGENHNFNYYLSSLCNAAGRKVAVSVSY